MQGLYIMCDKLTFLVQKLTEQNEYIELTVQNNQTFFNAQLQQERMKNECLKHFLDTQDKELKEHCNKLEILENKMTQQPEVSEEKQRGVAQVESQQAIVPAEKQVEPEQQPIEE